MTREHSRILVKFQTSEEEKVGPHCNCIFFLTLCPLYVSNQLFDGLLAFIEKLTERNKLNREMQIHKHAGVTERMYGLYCNFYSTLYV